MLRIVMILLPFLFLRDGQLVPAGAGLKVVVLGTVQDGGWPHPGCSQSCCAQLFASGQKGGLVASLGIIDPSSGSAYLVDATPDLPQQLYDLNAMRPAGKPADLEGIFLTHAHIGHYSGLMYLGREALSSKNLGVYAMPRMQSFLQNNGPWSQLVSISNISLQPLQAEHKLSIGSFSIEPFPVPHRDEFSETVGFAISGKNKSLLYIPDIDKWAKWDRDLVSEVKRYDYLLLDGTFYDSSGVNNRSMKEVPHPFIVETMALLKDLPLAEKRKIWYIHLNHSNPLLNENSPQLKSLRSLGFGVARRGQEFQL